MNDEDFFDAYCPKCDEMTAHRDVDDDEIFEYAVECMKCHMIWEAEEDIDDEDDNES